MTKKTEHTSYLTEQWHRSTCRRGVVWLCQWKHLRVMLFMGVGLITIVALFFAEENWRGSNVWKTYEAKLKSRNESISPEQLIPPPIADDINFAATPFWTNLPYRSSMKKEWQENTNRWPELFGKAYGMGPIRKPVDRKQRRAEIFSLMDLPALAVALQRVQQDLPVTDYEPTDLPPPSDAPAQADAARFILEELEVYEPVLAELRAAIDRPESRYPVAYDTPNPWAILLPHLARIKGACQVLSVQAVAKLALGRPDQALEDIRLMLKLADSIQTEPLLISYLVRVACLQISISVVWHGQVSHSWQESHLRQWQEWMEPVDLLSDHRRAMQGERMWGNVFFNYLIRHSQRDQALEEVVFDGSATIGEILLLRYSPTGWFYMEQANYNQFMDQMFQGALPVGENQPRVDPSALDARAEQAIDAFTGGTAIEQILAHRRLSGLLLPALGAVYRKTAQRQALVEMSVLACALERHRLEHGEYPVELSALIPAYIDQMPDDVVSTHPYHYEQQTNGQFILYSEGWNEQDDGGTIPNRNDPEEGDWVWHFPSTN